MATQNVEQKTIQQVSSKGRKDAMKEDRRPTGEAERNEYAHNQHEWRAKRSANREDGLEEALGWFSLGLGLAEIIAPRSIAQVIGVPTNRGGFIRSLGVREVASGLGILARRAPARAVWSRVMGDVIDLGWLGAAFLSPGAKKGRVLVAAAAVTGVTVLDVLCAQQLSRDHGASNVALPVRVSLAINRSPEELYRYWHEFENLPRFMTHLESVRVTGDGRSHWVAKGPAGTTVEWDSEITADWPNEEIAWRTVEGADVDHAGSIRFEADGARGTIVTVEMQYNPPAGRLGATVVALFGEEPNQTVKADLRRFKQIMETGEVVTTEGQPAGRASSTSSKYDQAARTCSETSPRG
jgi:uncharacterized membrane protein